MSAVEVTTVFDPSIVEKLRQPANVLIVDRENGSEVERVSVLRFAGHYRVDGIDAFAVKDAKGKFGLRSARQLGLTDDSDVVAYVVSEEAIDLR